MGCDDYYPPKRSSQDIAHERMRDLLNQAQAIVSYGQAFLDEYERRGLKLKRYRKVIIEYINEVESGEKFDALVGLVYDENGAPR